MVSPKALLTAALFQLCLLTLPPGSLAKDPLWYTHMQEARAACEKRDFPTAEKLYRQSARETEQEFGPKDLRCTVSLKEGKYVEAEALLHEVVDGEQRLLGQERLKLAISGTNLGLIYYHQGRYHDAELLDDSCGIIRAWELAARAKDTC
jgi:hypothetical protein